MHTSESEGTLLALRDLEAGYAGNPILHRISLTVPRHAIVTLIGANGAGKSTMLRTIFGILKPMRGRIFFEGKDITEARSIDRIRLGIAYCPQGRANFPRMTVRENLEMGAYQSTNLSEVRRVIEELFALFPILREKEREYAGNLSGGQQQVLEMAMALVVRPKLLLIDEPSMGLSPMMVDEVFGYIRNIRQRGITILMVEQNARRALAASDIGVVLELGRLRLVQPAQEMLNNDDVRRHYLGSSRVRGKTQQD